MYFTGISVRYNTFVVNFFFFYCKSGPKKKNFFIVFHMNRILFFFFFFSVGFDMMSGNVISPIGFCHNGARLDKKCQGISTYMYMENTSYIFCILVDEMLASYCS